MSEPIRPCPFCGGAASPWENRDGYVVMCSRCYARTDTKTTSGKAALDWDARAPSTATDAERAVVDAAMALIRDRVEMTPNSARLSEQICLATLVRECGVLANARAQAAKEDA